MKKVRLAIEVTGQEFGDRTVVLAPSPENEMTREDMKELLQELIDRGYEAEIVVLRGEETEPLN